MISGLEDFSASRAERGHVRGRAQSRPTMHEHRPHAFAAASHSSRQESHSPSASTHSQNPRETVHGHLSAAPRCHSRGTASAVAARPSSGAPRCRGTPARACAAHACTRAGSAPRAPHPPSHHARPRPAACTPDRRPRRGPPPQPSSRTGLRAARPTERTAAGCGPRWGSATEGHPGCPRGDESSPGH